MTQTNMEKQISRTKIRILETPNQVFFATVAYALKHEPNEKIPTACTDGKSIQYGTDFWNTLSEQERLGLMLHETYHVAFNHCFGMGRLPDKKDHPRWNAAADYVINGILDNSNIKLPAGGMLDHKYDNMSTEQVFDLLDPDDFKDDQQDGDLVPSTGDQADAQADLADLLSQAAVQAEIAGQGIGSLPSDIQIYLDGLKPPKINWKVLLQRYLRSTVKDLINFKRPNRRYMPSVYVPTRSSEALGDIAMIFDMSCSVSKDEINQYLSDTFALAKSMKPKELKLVQFSTHIISADTVKTASDIKKIEFRGRGGTDINPPVQWIIDNNPTISIIFTDGDFYKPIDTPDSPVLWVIHNNPNWIPPFGKAIHITI